MPYIYAIEIPSIKESPAEFHPCSEETAATHDMGRWKLVSHTGTRMTGWVKFNPKAAAALKYGKGSPFPDAAGQMLASGDFVMTTINKYADLCICEVVEFTPQKIRIRNLKKGWDTVLKNPEDIVKVDKALFL